MATTELIVKCSFRWYAKPVLFVFAVACLLSHKDTRVPAWLAKRLIKAEIVEN